MTLQDAVDEVLQEMCDDGLLDGELGLDPYDYAAMADAIRESAAYPSEDGTFAYGSPEANAAIQEAAPDKLQEAIRNHIEESEDEE